MAGIPSPDTTSRWDNDVDMREQEPRSRERRMAKSGRQGGGVFQQDSTKEGYGKHITSMHVRNIFNQGNQVIRNIVKQQRYELLDFTGTEAGTTNLPKIIPYQCIGWWRGLQNAANVNQTINNMIALNTISYGVRFLKAKLCIEVYAVTRKRLIQTGATSYYTDDFEQGQNLFIGWADRKAESIPITTPADLDETKLTVANTTLFDANNDNITKEEVPTREKWCHTWDFDVLNHNYLWEPNNLDSQWTLIPGAQAVQPTATPIGPTYQEIVIATKAIGANESALVTTIQDRRSYPRLMLSQPQIKDETDTMKFKYQIRISTELEMEHHIKPDIANPWLTRQTLPLPALSGDGTTRYVPCVPYETHVSQRNWNHVGEYL